MARQPRIVLPNVVHHVVSRGANKTILFANGSEKERYLRRFSLIAAEEKVLVQGYCIMDNHVHWLLTPTSAHGLARLFRRVHTWWAMTFNRKHRRSGPLMQGRFHSSPLSEDHYWTALRYVELNPRRAKLEMRRGTRDLAQSRAQLLVQLANMAKAEQELERSRQDDLDSPKDIMVRFDGNGIFSPDDLKTVSAEYEKRFHEPLPISALGQTLMHQSLGFDHRNRVDVALSPDQKEGLWLRAFLERLHIPYLAFREAIPGAATGAHIHIGPASTRLKTATL